MTASPATAKEISGRFIRTGWRFPFKKRTKNSTLLALLLTFFGKSLVRNQSALWPARANFVPHTDRKPRAEALTELAAKKKEKKPWLLHLNMIRQKVYPITRLCLPFPNTIYGLFCHMDTWNKSKGFRKRSIWRARLEWAWVNRETRQTP